ncbi:MAG: glycosyltransferase [Armatimonadota bacterium]
MSTILRDLRVCFVVGTLGHGGAERQLYYMLRALKASQAQPHVLCLTTGEYWEGPIRELGIPVSYVGDQPSRLARALAISAAVRALRPHLVQSAHFYTNLYAVVAARAARLPEIGAIRSNVISELAAHPRPLGSWSLRWPRLLAANSMRGVENAVRFGLPSARLAYLPNVVDTDRFQPGAERQAPVCILGVGRLAEPKRFDRFLDVLARVRTQIPAVTALIAGDGPERERLLRQAADRDLDRSLQWLGMVEDTPAVFRRSDLLLLTSDYEGTPNVLLEAQAAGLPVVATRVGGVPEVIADGETGFMAERDDLDGLVARTLTLVRDRETRTRMGRAARQHVLRHFSVSSLPGSLAQLYSRRLA